MNHLLKTSAYMYGLLLPVTGGEGRLGRGGLGESFHNYISTYIIK